MRERESLPVVSCITTSEGITASCVMHYIVISLPGSTCTVIIDNFPVVVEGMNLQIVMKASCKFELSGNKDKESC
jgi:hypothetical protein